MGDSPVKSFEELRTWQQAQELAVSIYKQTQDFPKEEQYGLTSQIRRAASSISANIAEGFGRRTLKDKRHFYTIAYGSLLETKNFLYLAQKLDFISDDDKSELIQMIIGLQKQINSSISSLRSLDED